jgi:phage repressor protein C with HTH and peptisase S24 domain
MTQKKRRPLTPEEKQRAARLELAWLKHKGDASQEDAAEAMGFKTQGAISQYIRGKIPLGFEAGFKFADFLGVPISEIEPAWAKKAERARPTHEEEPGTALVARSDILPVPVMEVAGGMGPGRVEPEHDTIIDYMRVSMAWVRRHLVISRPAALRIMFGDGDSMWPTFDDGDLLLVDTGITELRSDGIYALTRGDRRIIVKRLQCLSDGAIVIRSDNKDRYEPEIVPESAVHELRIIARVVWAWRGTKL